VVVPAGKLSPGSKLLVKVVNSQSLLRVGGVHVADAKQSPTSALTEISSGQTKVGLTS